MSSAPLILLASARKQSDTKEFLGKVFGDTGHQVIDLLDANIGKYDYSGSYPSNDGFMKVVNEMLDHEVIVFATPVYWYAMSGLMKTFFDRLTDLITIEKGAGRKLKGKRMLLLSVGADEELPQGFEIPFKLTAEYFEMNFDGSIYYSTGYPKEEKQLKLAIDIFRKKMKI